MVCGMIEEVEDRGDWEEFLSVYLEKRMVLRLLISWVVCRRVVVNARYKIHTPVSPYLLCWMSYL
jgi:hypothetical protein